MSVNRDQSEGDTNISPRRVEWQADNLDARTRALLEEDARYFLHQSLSTPCLNVLRFCEGIYIEDLQGKRYMDFHGNNVHQVGFSNPEVITAIKSQLDELSFCTRRYTNRVTVDLAKKLAEIAPGKLNKVLLCPGGASAIGIALQLARVATGRYKTISMWDSFHGASLEAISIGGEAQFRGRIGPLLPGSEHVPPPDEYHCLWDCHNRDGCDMKCAEYVEYILEKEGDVAAVIAEPIRSTPYIPRPEYWQIIRQACDRYGALLIFDEVPHALGRTGKLFTCQHFDVVPDILVIGKGLGGGVLPLAGVIANEELDLPADRSLGHYTHEKSPVACAAALATIKYIEDNDLAANADQIGRFARERMEAMMEAFPLIGDVRGLGLLMGMELVSDRETRSRASDKAEAVMYRALSKGLSFKTTMGNILTLTPPLTITRQEMDQAMNILEQSLREVQLES